MTLFRSLIAVVAVQTAAFAGSVKNPSTTQPAPASSSFSDANSLSEYFLGKDNAWDATYDSIQQWKKDTGIHIGIGADHWWHVDTGGHLYGNGYGVPGEGGTYRYNLTIDVPLKLSDDGFLKEIGLHALERIRDSDDKLRSFYRDTKWSYEAYAYAKTSVGTFKVGQIPLDFGIGWNNSWWEGVGYFDGYKFNPAYGVSWENVWKASDTFSINTTVQYFLQDDRVSGAIAGADAESTPPLSERNTFAAHIVPTWKLSEDTKLSWGLSGLERQIHNAGVAGISNHQTVWGSDLTLAVGKFSIFGEYTDSHGVITPARYVSGGPSDRQNSISTGIAYKFGPITPRLSFSKGWDHNPSGHQYIFNPGVTIQIAKNLTLYTEYVKWEVTDRAGKTSPYDDGVEFALVWNF